MAKSNAVQNDPGGKGRRPPTKWGDREQRRIDILEAAHTCIVKQGYLALNMRDLAADAGISPATLYSYFASKETLFATLYVEAIREHTRRLEPVAQAGHDLVTLLRKVLESHLELYRTYGRHFTLWSAMRSEEVSAARRVPRELIEDLRAATLTQARLQIDAIRAAAEREGRRIADDRLVPSFLWSAMTGLADHVTSERRALDPYPAEQLFDFAAQRLALAITDPAESMGSTESPRRKPRGQKS